MFLKQSKTHREKEEDVEKLILKFHKVASMNHSIPEILLVSQARGESVRFTELLLSERSYSANFSNRESSSWPGSPDDVVHMRPYVGDLERDP